MDIMDNTKNLALEIIKKRKEVLKDREEREREKQEAVDVANKLLEAFKISNEEEPDNLLCKLQIYKDGFSGENLYIFSTFEENVKRCEGKLQVTNPKVCEYVNSLKISRKLYGEIFCYLCDLRDKDKTIAEFFNVYDGEIKSGKCFYIELK